MKKLVVLGTGVGWVSFSAFLMYSVDDVSHKAALAVLFLCILAGVGWLGYLESRAVRN